MRGFRSLFLLGKLNFEKEFRNLHARPEGTGTRITAEPKTGNLPTPRWNSCDAQNRIPRSEVTGSTTHPGLHLR